MGDIFEPRVRTAAIAAWWTVLIAGLFLLLQWIAYMVFVTARPPWFLTFWGPDSNWSFVQTVWFWGVAALKVFLWILALVALWLTLWARQLRRLTSGR